MPTMCPVLRHLRVCEQFNIFKVIQKETTKYDYRKG